MIIKPAHELTPKELTIEFIKLSKYLCYYNFLDMPMACFAVMRLTELLQECAGQSLKQVVNNNIDNGLTGISSLNLSEIYDDMHL